MLPTSQRLHVAPSAMRPSGRPAMMIRSASPVEQRGSANCNSFLCSVQHPENSLYPMNQTINILDNSWWWWWWWWWMRARVMKISAKDLEDHLLILESHLLQRNQSNFPLWLRWRFGAGTCQVGNCKKNFHWTNSLVFGVLLGTQSVDQQMCKIDQQISVITTLDWGHIPAHLRPFNSPIFAAVPSLGIILASPNIIRIGAPW